MKTMMSSSSHVLDVGSGLGYHVHALNEHGISAVGLDSSKAMVRHAKEKYGQPYIHGNVMNTSIFPEQSFTHVMCLYYTMYCWLEKETFFHNVHHWLVEDGILFIHGAHPWKYGDSMIGEITYESEIHNTMFKEKITRGQTYTVHHVVYVMSKEELIHLAKQCHFTYVQEHSYENNYILVFKKDAKNSI
jgi:ubiquinone/menaquinone biosynthesis C-methylase UbiE